MPSMSRNDALRSNPDPASAILGGAQTHNRVVIIEQQGDFVQVRLPDVLGHPQGWVHRSAVSDDEPVAGPIDKEEFARECWRYAIYLGVNPHYLAAVAEMRSGTMSDRSGQEIGPFRLLQTEWDADWNGKEFSYEYDADDIGNWRCQCAMFALMARRSLGQLGATPPSALDLYLAQIVGAKAAAAVKQDPSILLSKVMDGIAAGDMPKGGLAATAVITRHAKFLQVAGAPATGKQALDAITAALQAALDATKPLILAGGSMVLDSPAAVGAALATNGQAAIKVADVDYSKFNGAGDVDSWIEQACVAAGQPHTDGWIKGYKTLCRRESSNDPNACNRTDINAKGAPVADGNRGSCSRGIAQCIPPTFAAYHVPGTSNAIYDPVANIAASMKYVRQRYHVSLDGSDLVAKVQQADAARPPKGY